VTRPYERALERMARSLMDDEITRVVLRQVAAAT